MGQQKQKALAADRLNADSKRNECEPTALPRVFESQNDEAAVRNSLVSDRG